MRPRFPSVRRLALAACASTLAVGPAAAQRSAAPVPAVVDSLLRVMTLDEKLGQLTLVGTDRDGFAQMIARGEVGTTNGLVGDARRSNAARQRLALQSRLAIPMLFAGDVVHGCRTIFPVPLAVASSWDPALTEEMDSVAAEEATAAGITWTFAPMVDIARDPRWGRVMEGAGEDPVLGAAVARAAVRGFQGRNLADPHTVLATAKHFAAYGAVEAGRDYNTVDVSERELRSVYLPPFEAAVDQGIGSIMAAFVSLDGVPATANAHLLLDILRDEWGFDGVLVSDYDAIPELQQHGVAASPLAAAAMALNVGVDIDLHSGTYFDYLKSARARGAVSDSAIDASVRRVLMAKYALGLFDDPFRYGDSTRPSETALLAKHRPVARAIARESMVLLRNEHGVLPLRKDARAIAVIGPLAADRDDPLGAMHALGDSNDVVTVLAGIREAVAHRTAVRFVPGTGIESDDTTGFAAAVAAARQADVAVMVVGESAGMSGEGDSRSMLGLPGNQLDLVKRVVATGTPVVVVLENGRPLTIPWLATHVSAILEAWLPGTEGGHAVADLLFGDATPSGKLPMTFPRDVGQIPIYYAHARTGRPFNPTDKYTTRYIDVPNTPLYPFGYGLSYTTFAYAAPTLDRDTLGWNDTLHVSVRVANTGRRAGTEVAQLYVRDSVASISPPVKRLAAFRRVTIEPGESAIVTFALSRADLGFYGRDMRYAAEPGTFIVLVGGSSDAEARAVFVLRGPNG